MALLGAGEPNPPTLDAVSELVVEGAEPRDITVTFFDIEGASVGELQDSLRRRGPKDQYGVQREAFAHWRMEWRWPRTVDGRADISRIEVRCTAEVTLPRWKPGPTVSPALIAEWERYLRAVIRHERGHLEHCFAHTEKVRRAVLEALQESPEMTVKEVHTVLHHQLGEVRALDRAYDAVNDHGRKEGVRLSG